MSRGKILEYLGMNIDYQRKGKFTFSMEDYVNKLLNRALYDMEGNAKTQESCHLNINDGAKKLPEEIKQLFHHSSTITIFM